MKTNRKLLSTCVIFILQMLNYTYIIFNKLKYQLLHNIVKTFPESTNYTITLHYNYTPCLTKC